MKKFRPTEDVAIDNIRRSQPKPLISDEDVAMQAALEGIDCFPTNAPKPPKLSKIVSLFKGRLESLEMNGR